MKFCQNYFQVPTQFQHTHSNQKKIKHSLVPIWIQQLSQEKTDLVQKLEESKYNLVKQQDIVKNSDRKMQNAENETEQKWKDFNEHIEKTLGISLPNGLWAAGQLNLAAGQLNLAAGQLNMET